MERIPFVIRGSRLQAGLTNQITHRHMILHAVNEYAALKQARTLALPGEEMAVVGPWYR